MDDKEQRIRARQKLRKEQRTQEMILHIVIFVTAIVLLIVVIIFGILLKQSKARRMLSVSETAEPSLYINEQPELDVQLLDINEYSRPGLALDTVNGIVIHYTANPGTTAQQNHDYFQGLKDSGETYASSHFIIGLEGEIIQCIPCNEVAYASNNRNKDTLAIECCISDESGKFNDQTYESLVHLVTWLMGRYDLTVDDVIRHYDITGKDCPKYFVENESAWDQFKEDLTTYINDNGVERDTEIQE